MLPAFVRSRLEARNLRMDLLFVVAFGVAAALAGVSATRAAGMFAVIVGLETLNALGNHPKVNERAVRAIPFLVVVGIGAYFAWLGALLIGGLVVAVGGWILLDIVYDAAYGGQKEAGAKTTFGTELDDASFDAAVDDMLELSEITRPLRDGPKTAAEVAGAADVDRERAESALEFLVEDAAVVTRSGDRYVLREDRAGAAATVRDGVGWVLRRVLRPFAVFTGGPDDPDDHPPRREN
ncbi:hypothetical protein ACNS7O_04890 [Haloferacaceae archaeon DSL9]